MALVYGIGVILILVISWINWQLLVKWFYFSDVSRKKVLYWLLTGLAWFFINYWWVRPEAGFFYQWINPFMNVSFIWLIGGIVLLCLFPLLFAVRRLARLGKSGDKEDKINTVHNGRRAFLQKIFYGAPLLSLGISARGVYSAEREMVVKHIPLAFQGLPRDLDGFTIAQISDTHLGPFFGLERLEEVLQLIMQEKPHLVVITGDLIDDLTLLDDAVNQLRQLSVLVPYGIYFCWGNHEYFHDISRIQRTLADSPVHILRNCNRAIKVGRSTVYVAGVDYPWPKDPGEKKKVRQQFMEKATKNIEGDAFTILLAHHPDFLKDAFSSGILLTLSGHTHGGQVALFGKSLLPLSYRYMRGLYQENGSYGYVSPGTGQWFPFRLGCPPEISIFTLKGLT